MAATEQSAEHTAARHEPKQGPSAEGGVLPPVRPSAARRVLVLLVTVVLIGITVWAGCWQLERARMREAAQAQQRRMAQASTLDTAALMAMAQHTPAWPESPQHDDEWVDRRVRLHGHWQAEHTVWLDNRSMDGKAGFFMVTPLALADGSRWVWVQRGWAPRDVHDRRRIPDVPTPAGLVTLEGRLAPRVSARFELGSEEGGAIRQNLALAQMQAMSVGRSLPWVVIQTDAAQDGLLRNWPAPASGADKNRAYAAQWFGMAAFILGLYVWFQLIGPLRRR